MHCGALHAQFSMPVCWFNLAGSASESLVVKSLQYSKNKLDTWLNDNGIDDTIRYDTIEEFNVESKAEYTA